MNNWIDPTVKQVWNVVVHLLHNCLSVVINTTAYHLPITHIYLLLVKSSTISLLAHYSHEVYIGKIDVTIQALDSYKSCMSLPARKSENILASLCSI